MTGVALCAAMPVADGAAPPEWLHLLPAGEVTTADGRGPYKVADPAAVIAASMKAGKLVLDENHATDLAAPQGLPSPARGWIVELQQRADGIWGRVEWNADAKAAHIWRGYRGVSPAIVHDKAGNVLSIARASLTNTPNLNGLTTLHTKGLAMDLRQQLTNIAAIAVDQPVDAIMKKLKYLLDQEDAERKPALATQHQATQNLVLMARRHQAEMAKAGVHLDYATAVRQVADKA